MTEFDDPVADRALSILRTLLAETRSGGEKVERTSEPPQDPSLAAWKIQISRWAQACKLLAMWGEDRGLAWSLILRPWLSAIAGWESFSVWGYQVGPDGYNLLAEEFVRIWNESYRKRGSSSDR